MQWRKLGKIYGPNGNLPWARHSALTPTPWMRDSETIRVFAGFRDDAGVSRIGWVDVDSRDPLIVKQVSSSPVLDVGCPGAFDDNGVILGDLIEIGDDLCMYYVGFQLVAKAKFLAFTGLAVSTDGGDSFSRLSDAPILDRCHGGLHIRAIHSIMREGDHFRVWYALDDGWQIINGTPYPKYHIRTLTSDNGREFSGIGNVCIDVTGSEYRIGRPRVFRLENRYVMHFTAGTVEGGYMAGYAESHDGVWWARDDTRLGIGLSADGWDSRHLCYPAVINCHGKTYMFYNGNDMGREGFGCAALETAFP